MLENLELGMYLETNPNRIRQRLEYIWDLFPRLAQRRQQLAGTMSGGEQRLLEIGRALLLEPKMVMAGFELTKSSFFKAIAKAGS